MKKLLFISLLLTFACTTYSQIQYKDRLLSDTYFDNAPEEIKTTKPFIRQLWFFEQRAYPYQTIPENAYENAIRQRDQLRLVQVNNPAVTWVSLGPTPGYYFNYGNISSRIVTGSYHPSNPEIIYVGPANGGVWKTTDGGGNWEPLTDYEASLAMGAIVIDPVNPEIVYAGTGEATYSGASYYGRGLLKTTDGGMNWTHITNGLPSSSYFSRLRIRPGRNNELLAALGYSGLYRSTNSGESWFIVASGRCDDVIFTPTGDTAFAIGSGTGFRRSTDGGVTFSSFGSGLPGGVRFHIDYSPVNPSILYCAIYTGSTTALYKSTDKGATWNLKISSFDGGYQAWYDMYVRVKPDNPEIVFVGIIDIFKSTNGGTSFTNITNGYSGGSVHVDQHYMFFHPADPNILFACNDGGIYKSTNNGTSFINMNDGLTLTQFYRIAASPFDPGRILGGTQDNGTQQTFSTINWNAAFGGDGGDVAFNLTDKNYIIGETQVGGLVRTFNNGANWVNATVGIDLNENAAWVAPIIVHPSENGVFYVARQKVYKSTNNGASWAGISAYLNGSAAVRELAISRSNPTVLFASSEHKVYRSTDGGSNWFLKSSGLPVKTVTSVYIHPENENVVLVSFSGFGGEKIYKSTDMGESWNAISVGLPDSPVNDLFIYTKDKAHPETYFAATDVGVFYTQDNGISWKELYDGLPNTVVLHLDFSDSLDVLRAGTHGRGVFEAYIDFAIPVELASFTAEVSGTTVLLEWQTASETNNSGFEIQRKLKNEEWETLSFVPGRGTTTELSEYQYSDEFRNFIYSGTVLYRLKQIDLDGSFEYSGIISAGINSVPDRTEITQNYPNPFNPSTTIRYTLDNQSSVVLKIINPLGQEIETLINGTQNAGTFEVQWNAQNYAPGVYFYFFDARDLSTGKSIREINKLIYLK
ncbi:MAG: hypothetical protein Kow0098_26900 [Ignavibacteriaceae bacterium]